MRNASRATAVALIGVGLSLGSAIGHAKGPNDSLVLSSPAPNTAVFSITNGSDRQTTCRAGLRGFHDYGTQTRPVAPQSTLTFTMNNVPAGIYSAWWNCNGGSDGDRRLVSVDGDPQPAGRVETTVSPG